MVSNGSTLADLARIRARGQRPDLPVVVGERDGCAWANRNGMFAIDARELAQGDLAPLIGLHVIVRIRNAGRYREAIQRLVLALGLVCVFDPRLGRSEWIGA